jgi:hypothetical protein
MHARDDSQAFSSLSLVDIDRSLRKYLATQHNSFTTSGRALARMCMTYHTA